MGAKSVRRRRRAFNSPGLERKMASISFFFPLFSPRVYLCGFGGMAVDKGERR